MWVDRFILHLGWLRQRECPASLADLTQEVHPYVRWARFVASMRTVRSISQPAHRRINRYAEYCESRARRVNVRERTMTLLNAPSLRLAGLCLLCSSAGPAWAQVQTDPGGPYLGGNVGWLRAGDLNRDAINQALQMQSLAVRTTSVDDRATGWKLFAGYRFDRHWAVEGGYTFLGRYGFQGQVIADPGTVQASFRADDWNAFAVGVLPLGDRFEIFGKAGAGLWRTRLQASGTFSGRGAQSADASGASPIAGLGVRLQFTQAFSARLEWERFLHIGDAASSGRSDIDFGSLGLQYRF